MENKQPSAPMQPTFNAQPPVPPEDAPPRRRFPWRIILIIVGVLVLLGAAMIPLYLLTSSQKKEPAQQPSAHQTTPPASILLTAAGDMLAHDTVNQNAEVGSGYDYTPYFSEVKSYMTAGDIRFCNQEGLSAGKEFVISGYPSFNAPTEFPRDLNRVGCNVINLANNHMADKGNAAIAATLDAWKPLDTLAVSGANRSIAERDDGVKFFTIKGHKFAFVSFNEANNNTSAAEYLTTLMTDANTEKLMKRATKEAEFVIVSAHWMSYEDQTEVGSIEEQWAAKLSNLGADVIIGTGPHVLQRAEWHTNDAGKRTFVWYSIGNFLSSQLTLKELIGGLALMQIGEEDGKLVVQKVGFLPTYMHYDWSAADAAAENLLTRKNLKLYPLTSDVDSKLTQRFDTNAAAQLQYVTNTLGPDVTLVTPQNFSSF